MKRNLLRCLTLGGALLLSLACNNARAGYVLEVQSTYNSDKNEWSFADGYWTDSWKNSSGERAKQVAVSNGVVYGAIPGTRVLNYWNPSTKSLGKTSQAGTEVGNNIFNNFTYNDISLAIHSFSPYALSEIIFLISRIFPNVNSSLISFNAFVNETIMDLGNTCSVSK